MNWQDILKIHLIRKRDYQEEIVDYEILVGLNYDIKEEDKGTMIISDDDIFWENREASSWGNDISDLGMYDNTKLSFNWRNDNLQTIDQQIKNKIATDFKKNFTELNEEEKQEFYEDYEIKITDKVYYQNGGLYDRDKMLFTEPYVKYFPFSWNDNLAWSDYKHYDNIEDAAKQAEEWGREQVKN